MQVGRPIGSRDASHWLAAARRGELPLAERNAVEMLGQARRRSLLPLVAAPPPLDLDEQSWRLGAAVHNLLVLSHPRIGSGPGAPARIDRVATAAAELARLGAPTTLAQTLARHSLLARLPEVARVDHTVRFWLGRRTFLGRRPPSRMLALPRLRNVSVETVRRTWLRDIGVQAAAREAFAALTEASPLGEALDPLRLDPPWSWGRVLAILKFPVICRLVAGRLVEQGVGQAGDALSEALYRYLSLQDTGGSVPASGEAAAFALGFLAHLAWLDHLFNAAAATTTSAPGAEGPGRELAVLLAVAHALAPALVWPADVSPRSDTGQGFSRYLDRLFDRHQVKSSRRVPAATELVRRAAEAARPRAAGNAVWASPL